MKKIHFALAALLSLGLLTADEPKTEDGYKALFNGKDLTGWKKAAENPDTFSVKDGAIVAHGPRCHLFYTGEDKPFKNFVLRLQVMTKPNSNGGVYVHTKYQDTNWPNTGHECQVNNSFSADPRKTASVYRCKDINEQLVKDDEWFDYEIKVVGKTITLALNGKVVNEWTEPANGAASVDPGWRFNEGTFALQGHDPGSTVYYRNIRVKRLPD